MRQTKVRCTALKKTNAVVDRGGAAARDSLTKSSDTLKNSGIVGRVTMATISSTISIGG